MRPTSNSSRHGVRGRLSDVSVESCQLWTVTELCRALSRQGVPAPSWLKKSGLVRLLVRDSGPTDDAQATSRRRADLRPARRSAPSATAVSRSPNPPDDVVESLRQIKSALKSLEDRINADTTDYHRDNRDLADSDGAGVTGQPTEFARAQDAPSGAGRDVRPHAPSEFLGEPLLRAGATPGNTGPVGFPDDVGQQHMEGTPSLAAPLAQQTREYGPAPTATFPAWAWGDSGATANYPQSLLRQQPPNQPLLTAPQQQPPASHHVPMDGLNPGLPPATNSLLMAAGSGIRSDSAPKVEIVPENIRRDVVQGRDVNLAAFLIPGYKNESQAGVRSIMADGVAVPLKPLTDPRLNRQLTIQEFIETFAIYKNVMCATYPHRRQELDFYERDIVDMFIRFGGFTFYDYHKAFSACAASLLLDHHIKIDWSYRDQNLFNQFLAGHKINACQICNNASHSAGFCPQSLHGSKTGTRPNPSPAQEPYPPSSAARQPDYPNQPKRPRRAANDPGMRDANGRARIHLPGLGELCNNFNSSGCKYLAGTCPYLHYCATCWQAGHSQARCPQASPAPLPAASPRPAPSDAPAAPRPRAPLAPWPQVAAASTAKVHKWQLEIPEQTAAFNFPNYCPPPIDTAQLERELLGHPDRDFVHALLDGLRHGFHTGFSQLPVDNFECRNLLSARSDPHTVTQLLNNELSNGYLIGLFAHPPFPTFRINPIGLAEKKYSQKKRLTVDMSAPWQLSSPQPQWTH